MNNTIFQLKNLSVNKIYILIVLLILGTGAIAQPQYFNNTYVGGANSIPFSPNTSTTFQRAQFVWGPGSFTGATAGAINKVYFYTASTTTSTFNNFVVRLGTSATNPLSSGAWYTATMQTALSSSSYTITTTTSNWASITLTQPIAYDPTKFLIIDISSTGTSAGGFTINQQTLTMVPGRVWGTASAGTPSGGDNLTPDFGFDLLKSANDVGITALVSPSNTCGSITDPLIVRIANLGSNIIAANQNIAINAELSGLVSGNYARKFNRALAIGASDTIHLATLSNTQAMIGNLNIKAWCRHTPDTAFRNDTLKTVFYVSGSPGPPSPKDVTKCGGGSAKVNAGVPSNTTGVWYSSATSNIALAIDSIFNTPFLNPGVTTFYVESGRLSSTKSQTTNIGPSGTTFGTGIQGGNMFNITANKSLKIDSLALNLNTANTVTVNVYAKVGSYAGSQTNAAAWTLIRSQKVVGKGIGKETRINMGGYVVPIGVYGIYVQASEGIIWNAGAFSFTNPDFSLSLGDAVINTFGTVTTNGSWSGNIYYRTVCTGSRLPVNVTIKPSPAGATFIKGTPFQSTQPVTIGTTGNPDIVAKGDVLTYEITPPTGHTNSSYNTSWLMSDLTFRTPSGRVLSSAYYSPSSPGPSGSNNAKVSFTPDASLTDSLILMTISIKDLGPHFCDSTLTRYIYVAPRPEPDFKFTQPVCDGDNVIFNNLSKIQSGKLLYKWDFSTGNAADTSNNSDVVFKFPTHGTYNVKLTAISIPFGYSETKTLAVVVTEIPKIGFKVFNACLGDSVSLVNSTTISKGSISYSWDLGNGKTSNKVNAKSKYSAAGKYQVSLTATSNGCSQTLTKNAWQFARPVARFNTPTVLCDKTDILFTNGSSISTGNMGYRWTFSDGGTSTLTNPAHTFTTPGSKTAKMRVISEFGCADSVTKSFTLAESPLAEFTYGTVCNLSNTNFQFTGTKPASPVFTTFKWDFEGEGSTTVESPSKLLSIIGKKNVTLTLTSNNGCVDAITKVLDVKLQSKAGFEVSDVCDGENVVFVNKSTVSSGNLNYLWKFGDGNNSISQSPRHMYAAGVSQTYNVTMVAIVPGGCSDSVTKQVSVNYTPKSDFTYKTSGRLIYFTGVETGNAIYHWDFGDGAKADGFNTQYNYLNSFEYGKFLACLYVENAAGCNSQTCKQIAITGDVKQVSKNSGIKVYPNPTQGQISVVVEDPKSDLSIELIDLVGHNLGNWKGKTFQSEYALNLQVANGVYLIKVTNGGLVSSTKITVSK